MAHGNQILFVSSLLFSVILSACGQSGSSVSSSSTSLMNSSSSSASSLSLSSFSSVNSEDYEDSMTWQKADHLYIHYNRSTADNPATDYADWTVWVWQKAPYDLSGVEIGWTYADQSGVIAEIDFSGATEAHENHLYKPGQSIDDITRIGFLIVKKSSMTTRDMWQSDGGTDMYINDFNTRVRTNRTVHIFAVSGQVSDFTFTYTGAEANDPYANDTGAFVSIDDVNSSNINNYPRAITSQDFYQSAGIGYQIFVRSFADSNGDGIGDIRGIIEKLDYLENLGVKALWLTPINTSETYHGYDVTDFYSISPAYGTVLDYAELIYKAKERDMRVVMDLVINHTSTQNVWFQNAVNLRKGTNLEGEEIDYRSFYHFKYNPSHTLEAPWHRFSTTNYYYYGKFASSMPELNYDYQGTRDAMIDVAKYWLSFGVSGFRLDAVKHVYMGDEVAAETGDVITQASPSDPYKANLTKNVNFFKEFNFRLKSVYPNAYIVGENFDGWDQRIAPYYQGMDSQLDFQNYYHLQNMMHGIESGSPQAQSAVFETKYQTTFKPYREFFINSPFTSNHDLPRVLNWVMGSKVGNEVIAKSTLVPNDYPTALKKASVHVAATLLMPGLSWIYYGDELGMTGNIGTNDNGTNFHLDRWYRQPFKWANETTSYDTGYTFEGYMVERDAINDSSLVQGAEEQALSENSMHRLVQTIALLKGSEPTLIYGSYTALTTGQSNVLAYRLTEGSTSFDIYLNFGSATASIASSGSLTRLAWNGATATSLPGYSILVRSGS